jgi:hypothetical protein
MHCILAVDDSAPMRQLVSFTLTSAGYEVVTAVDTKDASDPVGPTGMSWDFGKKGGRVMRARGRLGVRPS